MELISPRRPLKPRRKPTRKAKAQVSLKYLVTMAKGEVFLSLLESADIGGKDSGPDR